MKNNQSTSGKMQNIKAKGYGIVAKLVMTNPKISDSAKAIYGYLCSYAGASGIAFPSVSRMLYELNMSEGKFYRHLKRLTEPGYVKVTKNKDKGKFANNVYTLCEEIPNPNYKGEEFIGEDAPPCPYFAGTVEAPPPQPYPQNPCMENEGATINNSTINNKTLISPSPVCHSQESPRLVLKTDKTVTDPAKPVAPPPKIQFDNTAHSYAHNYTTYEKILKNNIEYNHHFAPGPNKDFVDSCIAIMLDVICSDSPTLKMGDEIKSREVIRSVYLKLEFTHIEHVIDRFEAQRHKIHRIDAYLRKMLFTVFHEVDPYYINLVNVHHAA